VKRPEDCWTYSERSVAPEPCYDCGRPREAHSWEWGFAYDRWGGSGMAEYRIPREASHSATSNRETDHGQ
jgi:hypothetical protein